MIPKLTKQVQLIGIHGKAHSGKDTIGGFISEEFANCYGDYFAGPLKDAGAVAFGIDRNDFDDPDTKELVYHAWGISPRKIAQFMGTEMFRDTISKLLPQVENSFWVHRMAHRINGSIDQELVCYDDGDTVLIMDVRFENEVDFIINNGGIIFHVVRDGADGIVGIPGHPSEALDWDKYHDTHPHAWQYCYRIINNGTKEELYDEVVNNLKNSHLVLHHKLI